MRREPEVPEAELPVEECFDCPARITSKGTRTNSFCEKWHTPECLFYKSENGCRLGEKCSYVHRQVEEQPSKKFKKNGDKSAVAMLKWNEQHQRMFTHQTLDNWVAYSRIWSRRSLFSGRAQTYGNQSDV